jgi:hypothetical protein
MANNKFVRIEQPCLVRISAEKQAILTKEFRDFLWSLQACNGIVPQLGPDHFDPNIFYFTIRLSFYHSMPHTLTTDSVV